MKLDKASYAKLFKDYFITGAVVRRRDMLYFVLRQHEEAAIGGKYRTRVVACIADPDPKEVWGGTEFNAMHRMQAGISRAPKEQFIGVTMNDHVYALGGGDNELENDLLGSDSKQLREANAPREAYQLRGGISHLRTIGGHVWGCALGRTVIRRNGRNDWNYFKDAIPYDHIKDKHCGFESIDGFSEQDIYAVGGEGDVWHFDGARWKALPFPSNTQLWSMCCAGDGFVYIAGHGGQIFKGRNNKWKSIYKGQEMALPLVDMVWFDNKVWCTSDYGLWTIQGDKLTEADVPRQVAGCSGHLSVGDGVMLLAGMGGAALHNGTDWEMIVDYGAVR